MQKSDKKKKSSVYTYHVSYSTKAPLSRGSYVLKVIVPLSCKSSALCSKNPLITANHVEPLKDNSMQSTEIHLHRPDVSKGNRHSIALKSSNKPGQTS